MGRYSREKGIELINTVYCGDVVVPAAGHSKFGDFMVEILFGELWADDTLNIRDRRLLLIGAIAALGDENTLTIQTRSALKRKEIDFEQLESIVTFLTQYIGYPYGSRFFMIANRLRQEMADTNP